MSNEITPVNVQPSSVVVKENENNNGNGKDYTYVIQNSAPDRFEYVTKAKSGKNTFGKFLREELKEHMEN